jgi:hypothetical protein
MLLKLYTSSTTVLTTDLHHVFAMLCVTCTSDCSQLAQGHYLSQQDMPYIIAAQQVLSQRYTSLGSPLYTAVAAPVPVNACYTDSDYMQLQPQQQRYSYHQQQQRQHQRVSVLVDNSSDSSSASGHASQAGSASSVQSRTVLLHKLARAGEVLESFSLEHKLSASTSVAAARTLLEERIRHYDRSRDLKSAFAVGHLLSTLVLAERTAVQSGAHVVVHAWMATQQRNAQAARAELQKVTKDDITRFHPYDVCAAWRAKTAYV